MSFSNTFEEGKIVAVMGGSIDNAGNFSESVDLCVIIAVGEDDLLVRHLRGHFTASEVTRVSKELCIVASVPKEKLLQAQVTKPMLGDLVISYEKKKWSDKTFTKQIGIICEISYSTGNPKEAKILCEGELVMVGFDNLMVLQRKMYT